jgi:hypothetical protein
MKELGIILLIAIIYITLRQNNILNYSNTIINNNDWLVVQYDNREFFESFHNVEQFKNSDYNKLIKINEIFCVENKFDYLFSSKNYDISPYWIKVKIIQDLINDPKSTYKGFIWLDTDAVIVNINENKNIRTIINDKSFFIAHDHEKYINNMLNCGSFFVKNDSDGRKIMNDWMDGYDPSRWTKTNSRWSTDGPWVGITYEQGYFNQVIYPKYIDSIEVLPWKYLQNDDPTDKETIITHFAALDKDLINKYY